METADNLANLYLECLAEVIEHYAGEAPTANATETKIPASAFAAVVGFGDENIRGTSVMSAERESITALTPDGIDDPMDWLGELNNQVVGRMKNRLVGYGLIVQMSTPITATGEGMSFASHRGPVTRWSYSWSRGQLTGLLGLTIAPAFVLVADANVASTIPKEGSLCFF